MDKPHTFNLGAYGPNARINVNSVDNSTNIVQAVYIRDETGIRLSDLTHTDFKVLELACEHMGGLIERSGIRSCPDRSAASVTRPTLSASMERSCRSHSRS